MITISEGNTSNVKNNSQEIWLFVCLFFSDDCRQLWFQEPTNGVALINHVVATMEVPDLELCLFMCCQEPRCVSLNLGPSKENSKRDCELCDADGRTYPHELNTKLEYLYQGLIKVSTMYLCPRHTLD